MKDANTYFPHNYEDSRFRFQREIDLIRQAWPSASLESHTLSTDQSLTIDWISAPALRKSKRLLVLTSGQHGIEAFAGFAMLRLFFDEFLSRLDPKDTSLLVIHPINPWGMKNIRRTNYNNVDLNRNFTASPGELDPKTNPAYDRLNGLLNPPRLLGGLAGGAFRLVEVLFLIGPRRFHKSALIGQYRYPKGLYFGGKAWQEETCLVMDLFRQHFNDRKQIVLLDMHTGYGQAGTLSVVTSPFEPRTSSQLSRRYAVPRLVKTSAKEFYSIRGDMVDYVYKTMQREQPSTELFAASFEFGTLGSGLPATLSSLRRMIFENQAYWWGTAKPELQQTVKQDFRELFLPRDERWRARALAAARLAFQRILTAEGYLGDG
jgi:hypothetical protein